MRTYAPAVLVAWLAAGFSPVAVNALQRNVERDVKSAFLLNFLTFVEWPPIAGTTAVADNVFRICLTSDGPFRRVLQETVRGETVGGQQISVDVLTDERQLPSCRVLFVPKADESRSIAILHAAERFPILVVGETSRVLALCGAIAFVVDGERMRFDVNIAAITARGLKVSSKLLRVARETSDRLGSCE